MTAVNNGNWQWIASTGTDPKPYFQRLFNPIIQSEKFDKQAEYIKKWIPELKDVPAKDIHKWESKYKDYDVKKLGYFEPIVEYKKARESVNVSRSFVTFILKKKKLEKFLSFFCDLNKQI